MRHTARGRRHGRTGDGPAGRPLPRRPARRDRRPRTAAAARPAPSVALRGQGRRDQPELLAAGRPPPAAPRVAAGRTGPGGDPPAARRVARSGCSPRPESDPGTHARRPFVPRPGGGLRRPGAAARRAGASARQRTAHARPTTSAYGSARAGSCRAASRSTSCAPTGTASTAIVAVHHGDPGCAPERMTVHALENCRTGRVRWHHDTGVLVAELLFDTRLRTGDTCLFRYGVEDGTAGASSEYVRGFGSPGGQYALQVRFAEDVPARALPPVHPALGGGAAQRPSGADAQRPPPVGAPGRATGAAGDRGDRVGLGVSG